MIRVLECIVVEHDPWLVLLAAVVCLLACFSTISLYLRHPPNGSGHSFWIGAAAVSFGTGVWSTHFIAMLAFRSSLPLSYAIGATALSAVVAILLGYGAFWMLGQSQRWSAGVVTGLAVGSMHFIGMTALSGPITIGWDTSYTVGAMLVGTLLSMFAFGAMTRYRGGRRLVGFTLVLTASICALHFTAMAAMEITLTPTILPVATGSLERSSLAISVAAITALVLALGLMLAYLDRILHKRNILEARRLRAHVAELEATQAELNQHRVELQDALKAADESNRAKSAFLAVMSHELRTPLNAIIGFSELMQMETKGPLGHADYRAYLDDICNGGRHLLNLVNGVLDLSKIEAGEMRLAEETFPVAPMLEECGRMMRAQAEAEGVELNMDDVWGDAAILGDRSKLRQVTINLLSNAIKFTPAGGTVSLALNSSPEGLTICCTDTGIGMNPDDQKKALEIFGQVDGALSRKHEGTGLGLPISARLVRMHDGELTIESRPEHGTRVSIVLPADRVSRYHDGPDETPVMAAVG